uniref:N-acetylglucosamine-1-phosphotransferase subunits alpha/beta isoform X2 n=1 Tax=Ciona intestinalis TaxID=7719 RepID=UPI0005212302|nr:N-acetylglucosamine-1-phosphotransferase subunits alpha/beta isoform X2 [Ciona intestinalis]|eukprot:XP_002122528.3 N-acetylglucosamine-1-phosphotransferase subunits alpha/beta isoform X2 [Ciona intestinalis]
MLWHTLCKLVQRQTYSCLSHKFGIYMAYAGIVIVLYSVFHFGEEVLVWSRNKYDVAFSAYHDNIASTSFQNRLCSEVPIDIVYTWVNGSDPELIKQLNELKSKMSLNLSSEQSGIPADITCNLKDCIKLPLLSVLPMIKDLTLEMAKVKYSSVKNLQSVFTLDLPKEVVQASETQASMLRFKTVDDARTMQVNNNKTNHTMFQAHVTSDASAPHSMRLTSAFILTSIPKQFKTEAEVKENLPQLLKDKLNWLHFSSSKNSAFIWLTDSTLVDEFAKEKGNSTLKLGFVMGSTYNKVDVKLAYFVGRVEPHESEDVISKSRFEDNEELRYSLRSVEKYAPWVRHIYIVTNGQIPYWLNMDAPRVTLVTHEEIFVNKSHLPTFSSPAIEAHIHRIPGLADKFIYLNDDVMFGKEVWPDDFYTHADGHKVYLAWSVPNCAEGCAPSWITDGYCDTACNVSACEWDGGDCTGKNIKPGVGAASNFGANSWRSTVSYCKPGCSNSWIADRFCDQACNTYECGFDAADCGISNFDKAYKIPGLINESVYQIPDGQHLAYIDLSKKFAKVSSASYEKNVNLRAAAVSNKFHVLTIIFVVNGNQSEVAFNVSGTSPTTDGGDDNVKGDDSSETISYQFKVRANPSSKNSNNTNNTITESTLDGVRTTTEIFVTEAENVEYDNIIELPEEFKRPQISRLQKEEAPDLPISEDDLNITILPEEVRKTYLKYKEELSLGYLTRKGYNSSVYHILSPYFELIRQNYVTKPHSEVIAVDQHEVTTVQQDDINVNGHSHNRGDPGFVSNTENKRKKVEVDHLRKDSGVYGRETFNRIIQRVGKETSRKQNTSNVESKSSLTSRKLLSIGSLKEQSDNESQTLGEILQNQPPNVDGFLPWENKKEMVKFQQQLEENERKKATEERYTTVFRKRKLLDTFGDSLRFVSLLYNKKYGFTQRKVPAHMPHMIDKNIMCKLQSNYPHEYDMTSSHKLRHSQDMQFAFSYFYYIMSELKQFNVSEIFDELDTDHSKVLSDREIRLLATQIFDLPLTLDELTSLESAFKKCAMDLYAGPNMNSSEHNRSVTFTQPIDGLSPLAASETYYDKEMPLVTREIVLSCDFITNKLNKTYSGRKKYKYVQLDETEVSFKMIRSNVSVVVGQLDDIRKHPKKFICLNDNIDHTSKGAETVKAVLQDFYETLFPTQSQFELLHDYRNRFMNIHDLREWKQNHERTLFIMHSILIFLLFAIIISFFWDQIYRFWRRHRHKVFRRGVLKVWKLKNKPRDPV